jgi:phenylalanyl-tRNA synthetase beta chain
LKGELESLLSGFTLKFLPAHMSALHPGRSANIYVTEKGVEKKIGWIGELHPKWQQHYELSHAPIAFEIDLAAVAQLKDIRFAGLSRMQAVRRDVALLVDDGISIQAILDATKDAKLPNLVDFSLFDVYRGVNLENGKKSLAFRIVMQDTERTLTDSECDLAVTKFVEVMSYKFGATIRK